MERWKGRVRERGESYEERKEKKRKEGGQRRTEEYGAVRRYRGVARGLTRRRRGRSRRVSEKKGDAEKRSEPC